ncbi:MAG: acetylornithine deacetylase [Hyphomicrobiaceae bacterium]
MTSASTAPSPREILARLVSFDTTSSKTNLPLLAYVEDFLAQHGVTSSRVPSPCGEKASLFASIGPAGSGIGLSGHTDVVPVTGQSWESDPFTLTERDGRLYGRGSADMKGFLACVMAAVPMFKRRKLAVPIHILFSYDEEVGCTGVRPMIAELGKSLPAPRAIIVGEPTSMTVVDAHKGPVRFQVEVTGLPTHSSMAHLGVNAITYAGRLLGELDRIEQELKAGQQNARFTPSYTTLQVGLINGGTAPNIVAGACSFAWEMRALPGLDVEAIRKRLEDFAARRCLPEMREVSPDADITIRLTGQVPAYLARAGSEAVSLALQLAGQNETFAVSYAAEAGLFEEAALASVICGPGDIAQAHTANEFIVPSELDKCMVFLDRLADWATQ